MSFSVEDKLIEIPMNDIRTVDKSFVDINIFINWAEEKEDVLKEIDSDTNFNLEIDFRVESSALICEYKVVNTSGPVLGFMGFYIDTASGYILYGTDKSREYIPFFNLYSYLEDEFGLRVTPDLMTSLIERFKVADKVRDEEGNQHEMTLADMTEEINKYGSLEGKGSVIASILFRDAEIRDEMDREFRANDLVEVFKQINQIMAHLGRNSFYTNLGNIRAADAGISDFNKYNTENVSEASDKYSIFAQLGVEELSGILDTVHTSARSPTTANDDMFSAIEGYLGDRADGEEISNHLYRGMSSMLHSHVKGSWNDSISHDVGGSRGRGRDITYENLNKSEARLINLYDIAEEREDESLLELDNVVDSASVSTSKDSIREVQEKIGVKEYLSGATLAHLSKTMKGASDDIRTYVDEFYEDYLGFAQVLNHSRLNKYLEGLKKAGRFYSRILDMIDKSTR